MASEPNKSDKPSAERLSKPDGFGGPDESPGASARVAGPAGPGVGRSIRKRPARKRRPHWKKILDRAVEDFAYRLREFFAPQMADDARAREFKKYAVLRLKTNLPPGPGRPPDAAITKAIQLRDQGTSWDGVSEACIPGFAELPRGKRQVLKSQLRDRCRSRRNTARRRKGLHRRKNRKRISDSEQRPA
jgi:hypothetical protein